MSLREIERRLEVLECKYADSRAQSAERLYKAIVALGLPCPSPELNEEYKKFLHRIPSETLEGVLLAKDEGRI